MRRPAGGRRLPPRSAAAPRGRPAGGLARSLAGRPGPPLLSPPPWRPRAAGSSGSGAPSCRAGKRGPGPAGTGPLGPAGKGCKRRSPLPQLGERWVGGLEQPLCFGKGLSAAPTLVMGLGAPGYPPARVGGGHISGIYSGYRAAELVGGAGVPPCNGRDARGTPGCGAGEFCWRKFSLCEGQGQRHDCPLICRAGQGRVGAGGRPCVHPLPHGKQGGGRQGLEGPPGLASEPGLYQSPFQRC